MSELIPPNWTPLERAMADESERISKVPVPLRSLWNPYTCPAVLLPWLAWAWHVDNWEAAITERQQREAIAEVLELHRSKGTAAAVYKIVQSAGFAAVIQEWWQMEPPGEPHTFTITLASINVPGEVQEALVAAINRVKPARAHMSVQNVNGFHGVLNTVAVARFFTSRRIEFVAEVVASKFVPIITNTGAFMRTQDGKRIVTIP